MDLNPVLQSHHVFASDEQPNVFHPSSSLPAFEPYYDLPPGLDAYNDPSALMVQAALNPVMPASPSNRRYGKQREAGCGPQATTNEASAVPPDIRGHLLPAMRSDPPGLVGSSSSVSHFIAPIPSSSSAPPPTSTIPSTTFDPIPDQQGHIDPPTSTEENHPFYNFTPGRPRSSIFEDAIPSSALVARYWTPEVQAALLDLTVSQRSAKETEFVPATQGPSKRAKNGRNGKEAKNTEMYSEGFFTCMKAGEDPTKTSHRLPNSSDQSKREVWAKEDVTALVSELLKEFGRSHFNYTNSTCRELTILGRVGTEEDILGVALGFIWYPSTRSMRESLVRALEEHAKTLHWVSEGDFRTGLSRSFFYRLWDSFLRPNGAMIWIGCQRLKTKFASHARPRFFHPEVSVDMSLDVLERASPSQVRSVAGRSIFLGNLWIDYYWNMNGTGQMIKTNLEQTIIILEWFNEAQAKGELQPPDPDCPHIRADFGYAACMATDQMRAMSTAIFEFLLAEPGGDARLTAIHNRELDFLTGKCERPADAPDKLLGLMASSLAAVLFAVIVSGYEGTVTHPPDAVLDYGRLQQTIYPFAVKTVSIFQKDSPQEFLIAGLKHLGWAGQAIQKHRADEEGRRTFYDMVRTLGEPATSKTAIVKGRASRRSARMRTPSDLLVPADLLNDRLLKDETKLRAVVSGLLPAND